MHTGLQLAKQLDSREDLVWDVVTELVDPVFGLIKFTRLANWPHAAACSQTHWMEGAHEKYAA